MSHLVQHTTISFIKKNKKNEQDGKKNMRFTSDDPSVISTSRLTSKSLPRFSTGRHQTLSRRHVLDYYDYNSVESIPFSPHSPFMLMSCLCVDSQFASEPRWKVCKFCSSPKIEFHFKRLLYIYYVYKLLQSHLANGQKTSTCLRQNSSS